MSPVFVPAIGFCPDGTRTLPESAEVEAHGTRLLVVALAAAPDRTDLIAQWEQAEAECAPFLTYRSAGAPPSDPHDDVRSARAWNGAGRAARQRRYANVDSTARARARGACGEGARCEGGPRGSRRARDRACPIRQQAGGRAPGRSLASRTASRGAGARAGVLLARQ